MKVIVTGNAGFIGNKLTIRLLNEGHTVIGIDNFNSDVYDSNFKIGYTSGLYKFNNFTQYRCDILDYPEFDDSSVDAIIHLAGYANVRMSFDMPEKYVRNNVETTAFILNTMDPKTQFIYASSSSVYGENKEVPFEETQDLPNIVSPYALTKKMCEDITDMYCRVKKISAIGLRFFTVYGRPDMAVYKFMKNIIDGTPVTVFGDGSMMRDYTHVSDIVDGIYRCLLLPPAPTVHKIYNLGNNRPISLNELIAHIELTVGMKAKINYVAVPPGEVPITYANINKATMELGFNPKIGIEHGVQLLYEQMKYDC
jgi:UDP-glucuronate 4-epimerase